MDTDFVTSAQDQSEKLKSKDSDMNLQVAIEEQVLYIDSALPQNPHKISRQDKS